MADEQVYEISCRYVSGAARTGCSYQLTGSNSTITSIAQIRNSDGYVVMSGPFSALSIVPCQATTIATGKLWNKLNLYSM